MQVILFQNRRAVFLWGFAALWLGLLAAMTWVTVRDGPPDGYSVHATLVVGAFFWLFGLGLLVFIADKPCYRLSIRTDGRAELHWRYPFHVKRRTVAVEQLTPAEVVETRDDEGDPYFLARVRSLDGDIIRIAESAARQECEQACDKLNAILLGGAQRR